MSIFLHPVSLNKVVVDNFWEKGDYCLRLAKLKSRSAWPDLMCNVYSVLTRLLEPE